MSDTWNGLGCSHGDHGQLHAAEQDDVVREETATSNVTDLRRSRQKARAVVRSIQAAVLDWLEGRFSADRLDQPSGARQANEAITRIASEKFRRDLANWLAERHKITAGRAVRSAHQKMRGATPPDVDADPIGPAEYSQRLDQETLRQVQQIDAGLLYDTQIARERGLSEPLAQELGDDITRQLRQGVANDETISDGLRDRVEGVLTNADAPDRSENGISGQTKRSKAELIAHDSVQDAYNQAARGRYLRNGFRYVVFDATIDTKTTDICRRMDGNVIDIVDHPELIPILHPYCRSGVRPKIDIDESMIVTPDDIADGYLSTIRQTKSYRPPADAAGSFNPTPLTRQQNQD